MSKFYTFVQVIKNILLLFLIVCLFLLFIFYNRTFETSRSLNPLESCTSYSRALTEYHSNGVLYKDQNGQIQDSPIVLENESFEQYTIDYSKDKNENYFMVNRLANGQILFQKDTILELEPLKAGDEIPQGKALVQKIEADGEQIRKISTKLIDKNQIVTYKDICEREETK